MKREYIIIFFVLVVALLLWTIISNSIKPGELDAFAQCLEQKGATFYGAFWCPHCQSQKALFGRSARLLPYVECSTPDGNTKTAVCKEKKIEGYPTWEFVDGTRESGELTLQRLSEKTGCRIPS